MCGRSDSPRPSHLLSIRLLRQSSSNGRAKLLHLLGGTCGLPHVIVAHTPACTLERLQHIAALNSVLQCRCCRRGDAHSIGILKLENGLHARRDVFRSIAAPITCTTTFLASCELSKRRRCVVGDHSLRIFALQ